MVRRLIGTARAAAWLLLLSMVAPAASAEALEGRWLGSLVVRPGEVEVELLLDVEGTGEGATAFLTVPVQQVERAPLTEVTAEKGALAFTYEDPAGDSRFEGRLVAETGHVVGVLEEQGRSYDVEFVPTDSGLVSAEPVPVEPLGAGLGPLVESFAASAGSPRLVVILAPTCLQCRIVARLLHSRVVDAFPDLPVLVVWEKVLESDDLAAAQRAARLLYGPGVQHYWSAERRAGSVFKAPLDLDEPAWDVVLLFAPDATWGEGAPPIHFAWHNTQDVPPEERFDTADVVRRLEALDEERRAERILGLGGGLAASGCACPDDSKAAPSEDSP